MDLEKQNILLFSRSPQHGGTENVMLQLCEILNPLVNKIVVVSARGFEVEKLSAYGIRHYLIPDIDDKSIKTMLSVIKIIKKIVEEEQISVIHTHHRMAAFYVRLTGLYKKCVFINTSHNTFYDKKLFTRFAYSKANLVACGEMVRKNLMEYFDLDKVTVIHNSVKKYTKKIITEKELEIAKQEGKFLVGNIGRLSEQKGMEYYIKAVSKVIKKHPEAMFYVIGAGEDEEKLKKMAEGMPIVFLGYRNDIQNIMSQLDLIVLTSLWEGLPLTPIEAFSVGKTIVATGVDGTVEIVDDNANGVIVEPRNIEQISEKICWMIEHPDERKEMEKNALKTFYNKFSFELMAKSYVDYYRKIEF